VLEDSHRHIKGSIIIWEKKFEEAIGISDNSWKSHKKSISQTTTENRSGGRGEGPGITTQTASRRSASDRKEGGNPNHQRGTRSSAKRYQKKQEMPKATKRP